MIGKTISHYKILEKLLELPRQGYVLAYYIAAVCPGCGEKDKALEWLDRAYGELPGFLVYIRGNGAQYIWS